MKLFRLGSRGGLSKDYEPTRFSEEPRLPLPSDPSVVKGCPLKIGENHFFCLPTRNGVEQRRGAARGNCASPAPVTFWLVQT